MTFSDTFFSFLFQGWYIITYALGIYHLNLLIAFLSPRIDPALEDLGENKVTVDCQWLTKNIVEKNDSSLQRSGGRLSVVYENIVVTFVAPFISSDYTNVMTKIDYVSYCVVISYLLHHVITNLFNIFFTRI